MFGRPLCSGRVIVTRCRSLSLTFGAVRWTLTNTLPLKNRWERGLMKRHAFTTVGRRIEYGVHFSWAEYECALQASGKGGRGFGHVFFAEFSMSDDDELRVITGGVGHVKFWTLNGRSGIKDSMGAVFFWTRVG